MKLAEIIPTVIADNKEIFHNQKPARVAKMVSLVLNEVAKEIDSLDEGKVAVAGFGAFIIKRVEREKDGVKAMEKRIQFRRTPSQKK